MRKALKPIVSWLVAQPRERPCGAAEHAHTSRRSCSRRRRGCSSCGRNGSRSVRALVGRHRCRALVGRHRCRALVGRHRNRALVGRHRNRALVGRHRCRAHGHTSLVAEAGVRRVCAHRRAPTLGILLLQLLLQPGQQRTQHLGGARERVRTDCTTWRPEGAHAQAAHKHNRWPPVHPGTGQCRRALRGRDLIACGLRRRRSFRHVSSRRRQRTRLPGDPAVSRRRGAVAAANVTATSARRLCSCIEQQQRLADSQVWGSCDQQRIQLRPQRLRNSAAGKLAHRQRGHEEAVHAAGA
eukprot:364197-Chlamydomonas_euryale.AAC.51